MIWGLIIFFVMLLVMASIVNEKNALEKRCQELEAYCISTNKKSRDTQEKAERIIAEAQKRASEIEASAQIWSNKQFDEITQKLRETQAMAEKIIAEAKRQASEIAGDALNAKKNAQLYEQNAKLYESTAKSMKNIISGYGNDYLIPSRTLLDDLADTYGYTQASQDYKNIRKKIREFVKNNLAADCDYAETNRRQTAISFITDAFNGKVDTIISQVKSDNFGTLRQKLIDAFTIVNFNGAAFRNARINEAFFNLRMEELRLACIIQEIRRNDIEEQRRIREQMREEEKARRDIEKAIKNAQKEEALLQKAMKKARAQLEQANAEQREAYEAQIAELEKKYQEAEERNKRAMSMAQQTKSGHVYIISNKGSFGPDIYKIGMTRRLEPLDRIRELSGASVPFSFDVHAMIWSEDAPALEAMLHKKFTLYQVNKVNFRKEFFKIPLSEIRMELEKSNLNVKWTTTAEATEYLESLAIEKAIQDNEQAREAWLNHQLELNYSDSDTLSLFNDEENNDDTEEDTISI